MDLQGQQFNFEDGILDLPLQGTLGRLLDILYRPPHNIKRQIFNENCPLQARTNASIHLLHQAMTMLTSSHLHGQMQEPQYTALFPNLNPSRYGGRGVFGRGPNAQIFKRRTFNYVKEALQKRHWNYWEKKRRHFGSHELLKDLGTEAKQAASFCLSFHRAMKVYFPSFANSPPYRCLLKSMALHRAKETLATVQNLPIQEQILGEDEHEAAPENY